MQRIYSKVVHRFAINSLIKWKNSQNHKPLILEGARQVGKTWLMKEFGKTQYKKVAYISFDILTVPVCLSYSFLHRLPI